MVRTTRAGQPLRVALIAKPPPPTRPPIIKLIPKAPKRAFPDQIMNKALVNREEVEIAYLEMYLSL